MQQVGGYGKITRMKRDVALALAAAALFGASTPLAKMLVGEMSPVLLGGLLYLGSGIGLATARLLRDRGWTYSGLAPKEWPWLLGAIVFGGALGPVALMYGLTLTSGSAASLLLNLEAVLTAVLAWVVFRENAGWRILLGMAAIVTGSVVLSWPAGGVAAANWLGPVAIAGACLCWAIDNNLTRRVSASDSLFIASSKGLVAGTFNCVLALALGASIPAPATVLATALVGVLGVEDAAAGDVHDDGALPGDFRRGGWRDGAHPHGFRAAAHRLAVGLVAGRASGRRVSAAGSDQRGDAGE